jgi:hypothetical protein
MRLLLTECEPVWETGDTKAQTVTERDWGIFRNDVRVFAVSLGIS